MRKKYKFEPDYITHPGETLKEKLEEIGMSQKEFAVRVGKPVKTISEIVNGKSAVVPETAVRFEKVLGIPASYWLLHQSNYDEFLARQKRKKEIEENVVWVNKFPYPEMAKQGLVKPTRKAIEKTEELFRFFNISSYRSWEDIYIEKRLPLSFRKSLKGNKDRHAISVLLRISEIEADRTGSLSAYDEKKFKDSLPKLKSIVVSKQNGYLTSVVKICAEAGVKLIFVPYLKKTNIFGVVRWIDGWPVVLMTDRNKRSDIFWFSLFHEFGHIILHGNKKSVFLDSDTTSVDDEYEKQADEFASSILLKKSDYEEIINRINLEDDQAIVISRLRTYVIEFDTHLDIILGRLLRHNTYLYNKGFAKVISTIDFQSLGT